jgi:hypothetical protein
MRPCRYSTRAKTWVKCMAAKDNSSPQYENLCILHNIFSRGLTFQGFDDKQLYMMDAFLTFVEKHCQGVTITPLQARELIHQCIRVHETKGILLGLSGKTATCEGISISRIVTASDFSTYFLRGVYRRKYRARDEWRNNNLLKHDLADDFEREEIATNMIGSIIRGAYRWAFVTQTKSLLGLNPDEVITGLGKDNIGHTLWVQINYPDNFHDRHMLRAPTFLSAGRKALFRSVILDSDGWGRAIRMDNLHDGLPEAVHEQCEVYTKFYPYPLGETNNPRGFERWKELFGYNKIDYRRSIEREVS